MDAIRGKLASLPWKQLQMLAKGKRIAANQKKQRLIDQLTLRYFNDDALARGDSDSDDNDNEQHVTQQGVEEEDDGNASDERADKLNFDWQEQPHGEQPLLGEVLEAEQEHHPEEDDDEMEQHLIETADEQQHFADDFANWEFGRLLPPAAPPAPPPKSMDQQQQQRRKRPNNERRAQPKADIDTMASNSCSSSKTAINAKKRQSRNKNNKLGPNIFVSPSEDYIPKKVAPNKKKLYRVKKICAVYRSANGTLCFFLDWSGFPNQHSWTLSQDCQCLETCFEFGEQMGIDAVLRVLTGEHVSENLANKIRKNSRFATVQQRFEVPMINSNAETICFEDDITPQIREKAEKSLPTFLKLCKLN